MAVQGYTHMESSRLLHWSRNSITCESRCPSIDIGRTKRLYRSDTADHHYSKWYTRHQHSLPCHSSISTNRISTHCMVGLGYDSEGLESLEHLAEHCRHGLDIPKTNPPISPFLVRSLSPLPSASSAPLSSTTVLISSSPDPI